VNTIDDFEVQIGGDDRVVVFASAARGELARFPAWERADRDLRHFAVDDIPTGSRDEPFEDADDGWRIEIFEEGEFVHVDENGRRFRVPRDDYFAAWEALIARYNPSISLEDLFRDGDES
jgi:hypothetical protein